MGMSRNPGQNRGNNNLIFIAGILVIILFAMIFWGMTRNSSIEQLISSAAPDSSAFASDSLLVAANEAEETAEAEEEKPEQPVAATVADSAAAPRDSANQQTPAAENPIAQVPVVSNEGGETIYAYKIRKGDTMYKLAAKFGNKPTDIMALNGLSDMSVQADKTIKVKVKALHSVGAGEGLNAIAEKYSVPAKSIKIANDMKDDVLSQGASILIPLK